MSLDLILRVGTKLILPFILLFALYVQFHGDYRPGRRLPGRRHHRRHGHPARDHLRP